MGAVRIQGLVASANRVRHALAGPVGDGRRERLRIQTGQILRRVDQILRDHGATADDLPAPSRRAYRFLKELDFSAVARGPDGAAEPAAPQTLRFPGLQSRLDALLEALAAVPSGRDRQRLWREIRHESGFIEHQLATRELGPDHLTPKTRSARGWLAFFSDAGHLDLYCEAVARAGAVFDEVLDGRSRFSAPRWIQFRPVQVLFRMRPDGRGTRVALSTPMICFDAALFRQLAGLAAGRQSGRGAVLEAMQGPAYQRIHTQLESLGGVVQRTRGLYHDLEQAFHRVNRRYFAGRLDRPRLTWNRTFTSRKFGHYDPVRDTVMVSTTLDAASVPAFVVDYIVYHELLHKWHGLRWRAGQIRAHTSDFKRDDERFDRFEEANAVLHRLARTRS